MAKQRAKGSVREINRTLDLPGFTVIAVQPRRPIGEEDDGRGLVILGYEGDGGDKDYYTEFLNEWVTQNNDCRGLLNRHTDGYYTAAGRYGMSFQEAADDFQHYTLKAVS
jgi:hypothetical protein